MKAAKVYSNNIVENKELTSNPFLEGIIEGIKSLTDIDFEHYVNVKIERPSNIFTNNAYQNFNSLALNLDVIKNRFSISKYATFQQIKTANGRLRKGAKSVVLQYFNLDVKHKETKKRISYEEYQYLSDAIQEQYIVSSFAKSFRVFNINWIENIDEININLNEIIDLENDIEHNSNCDEFIETIVNTKGLVLRNELCTVAVRRL